LEVADEAGGELLDTAEHGAGLGGQILTAGDDADCELMFQVGARELVGVSSTSWTRWRSPWWTKRAQGSGEADPKYLAYLPIAGHAREVDGELVLRGAVYSSDGTTVLEATETAGALVPADLGTAVDLALVRQVARQVISAIEH
jgi:hypothetical protein